MNSLYNKHLYKSKRHMFLMALVFIGALNTALHLVYEQDIIDLFSNYINNNLQTNYPIDKFIYLLILFATLFVIVKRDTWLPFLGTSVLPESLVPLKTPSHANSRVTVQTRPNSKIAYWSTLPIEKDRDVDVLTAYGDFSNSGVVMSDNNGFAHLPIQIGSGYIVPNGQYIPRHVHYRVLGMPYGLIGKVKTVYY